MTDTIQDNSNEFPTPEKLAAATDEELIQCHVAATGKVEKLKAMEDKLSKLKSLFEGEIAKRMADRGIDNIKVSGLATVSKRVSTHVGSSNIGDFKTWLAAQVYQSVTNDEDPLEYMALLESRIAKTAVSAYLEQHGELPPTLSMYQQEKLVVTRARS